MLDKDKDFLAFCIKLTKNSSIPSLLFT
jgi:hypothetical protein